MTLLLLLRPRHDCHDPGADIDNIKRIRKRMMKEYERKRKRKKKVDEKRESIPEPIEETRSIDSEISYCESILRSVSSLRDRLLSIREALDVEAFRRRIRRIALRELAIREYLAELRQQEEDEAIMLMLWELVN